MTLTDILIPVKQLINGDSIVHVPVDGITHHYVERPADDIVFTEGLAAETYLNTGDRAAFDTVGRRPADCARQPVRT